LIWNLAPILNDSHDRLPFSPRSRGFERVGMNFIDTRPRYATLNVNATKRLIHAARRASLEGFVVASSSSVYW
jgi:hypothetical protein